jgi:hypothetical protein
MRLWCQLQELLSLESPVTIERMGIADIKSQHLLLYGLENMKEVQMNTSSLSLSLSTPWFCNSANTRFMQLVDGMDNFSFVELCIGNLISSEIDVQSVELLPGASSALYGANAFNGILFMTSQSPFTSQELLLMQNLTNKSKAAGQTTMLITELEWRI